MDREKINKMQLVDKYKKNIEQRKKDLVMLKEEIDRVRSECQHGPFVLLDKQKYYMGSSSYDRISAKCLICGASVNSISNEDLIIDLSSYYTEEVLSEKRSEMQMRDARNLFMSVYNQHRNLTEEEIVENIKCKLNQKDKQKVKKY